MRNEFTFRVEAVSGAARMGVISTPRGDIRTPAFMPVGTAATVKAVYTDQLRAVGADVLLCNTYHLMLRPSAERVAALGGLHEFMQWDGPILTDSGGFQVMSLSGLRKISEHGVTFRSHIDGSAHELTPERAIEIQCLLGSDIQMVFDECTPFPATEDEARASMELSMRWAARSREAFGKHGKSGQALFGIIQGGVYENLRHESLDALLGIDFPGYAIGGLAVGEGRDAMLGVLDYLPAAMPSERPRYLMGVGKPDDIVDAVARGVDMFDCVLPTRSGRHGQAFTWSGPVNVKNARYSDDPEPLDSASPCPASSRYSKAYLNHLFRCGEYLGPMLLSWHNIAFYQQLMAEMRMAIAEGAWAAFETRFRSTYKADR
ncbi:MAG: tRNA guanosine(34) transglycosylase Tgt [Parvularculaceae bacterium]